MFNSLQQGSPTCGTTAVAELPLLASLAGLHLRGHAGNCSLLQLESYKLETTCLQPNGMEITYQVLKGEVSLTPCASFYTCKLVFNIYLCLRCWTCKLTIKSYSPPYFLYFHWQSALCFKNSMFNYCIVGWEKLRDSSK